MQGLRKRFGPVQALDGLDLNVPVGTICGFLGPNGAGKTTTIRALLGLIRPDEGEVQVLGHQIPTGLVDLRGHVGAIVDQPAVYPPLSGKANLQLVSRMRGTTGQIDEVLDLVGLSEAAQRRTSTYSFGMRQRLALAAALLGEPELLILDEPASGLDPAGQRDLHQILEDIRSRGATLLISSHMLAEVEMLCDYIAIIDRGRLIATGRTADLLGSTAATVTWVVEVSSGQGVNAASTLSAAGLNVTAVDDATVHVEAEDPAWVTYHLGTHGIWLRGLLATAKDLRSLFLELTERQPPQLVDTPSADPEADPEADPDGDPDGDPEAKA